MRLAAVGLLLAVGALAAGCGGDEQSSDDAAAVRAVLRASAEVQRAVGPLYLCLPEEPECYRNAGPELVEAVERQRAAVEAALADADDDCLQEAMRLYRDSLAAYGEAGEAASAGETAATDTAITRTTELEISYLQKIDECGFVEGKIAESSAALRGANVELLRVSEEFTTCVDEACVVEVARRGREVSRDGAAAVGDMLADLAGEEGVPPCYPAALRLMRRAFQAAERSMQALVEFDVAAAEREGLEAGELETQAQEDLAACAGAAGS
jgi:hypothetical protein